MRVLGGLLIVTAVLGVVGCGSADEKSASPASRTTASRQPTAAATKSPPGLDNYAQIACAEIDKAHALATSADDPFNFNLHPQGTVEMVDAVEHFGKALAAVNKSGSPAFVQRRGEAMRAQQIQTGDLPAAFDEWQSFCKNQGWVVGTPISSPSETAPEASPSAPDFLQVLSDPFAETTCKADQAVMAPGGSLVADSNATVADVLPVLQAMGPDAARIAGLPTKTRLAICVYRRSVAASSTNDSETKTTVACPSGFLPIVLTPGGPLIAFTIAESGQRMAMPTHPPSFLSPCMTPAH